MKINTEKILKPQNGVAILFAGIISLFIPHFSGWVDIVFPSIGIEILLPYILWKSFFVTALILLFLCVFASFAKKASRNTKFLFTSLMAVLIFLFIGIYPNFATEKYLGSKQRASFFQVGGQTRIIWAGGAKIVRDDALLLLTQETDEKGFVSQDKWATSLKRLGVYWIRIDRETQSVIIYIPRTEFFDSAQFGYLIPEEKEPKPNALDSKWYRLWELDDGVYFFQQ